MMQYPLYASYPYIGVYPFYSNYFGSGYPFGQAYGNYYGYQPWMAPQGNPTMKTQHGNSGTGNPSVLMKTNGYYPNYQQMSSKYVHPQCNLYQYPWSTSYALTNWFNPQQTYSQMAPWTSYYNYNYKWTPMRMNFNTGMYYSWPMMDYNNQMMYPNYLCPSPTYWGVQQTLEMPHSESKQNKMPQRTSSESKTLNVTSSDVIRDFNLPPAVAKKTRSDIPRPSVDCSDIKESEKSKEDIELPYLFRVSDTSIKQIASSRSFGPSMVYNTDSDNKPLSAHW